MRIISDPLKKAADGGGEAKIGFGHQTAAVTVVLKGSGIKTLARMHNMTPYTRLSEGHG